MIEVREDITASKATISRLPVYLRFLRDKVKTGAENVSSTFIAEELRLNPVQVRKDLALVCPVSGKPKLGFNVHELIESIEKFLGLRNTHDAVLCGVGSLGSTLLKYEGFKNYGFHIVAAFDTDPATIGKKVNGISVLSFDTLPSVVRRLNVQVGIITVPKDAAQTVADAMARGGIRAVWNFAPTHLNLPEDIAVKYEDLAASLALLSKKLEDKLKEE